MHCQTQRKQRNIKNSVGSHRLITKCLNLAILQPSCSCLNQTFNLATQLLTAQHEPKIHTVFIWTIFLLILCHCGVMKTTRNCRGVDKFSYQTRTSCRSFINIVVFVVVLVVWVGETIIVIVEIMLIIIIIMAIPIVIGALRTVPRGLENSLEEFEIERRLETIQTTALLRSDRILRRVLKNWGDWLLVK